jgi:hypothetical protein
MLDFNNNSPFAGTLIPSLDKHGNNFAVAVIKGTFDIHPNSSALSIANEQMPIQMSDAFYGKPGESSIQYETDIAPIKPAIDVILNGYAYAPTGNASMFDASLQIDNHKKILRVIGDRYWVKSGFSWQPSSAQKFDRMAVVYENAYGGSIQLSDDPMDTELCTYNPIGKGFVDAKGKGLKEGLALPNIENPSELINHYDDRPMPIGVGAIARNWQPRLGFAGTYDQLWQQERKPLLPMDFDNRYHNAAHPLFTLPKPIANDAEIIAINFSESGYLTFKLPNFLFAVTAIIRGKKITQIAEMDTIVIEPEINRVLISWRTAIPCANRFLYIEKISVDWSLA